MVTNFTKIIPFFNNSLPFQFELEKYEKIKFTEKKRKKTDFLPSIHMPLLSLNFLS